MQQQQTAIHEYQFGVERLAVDLTDGIRLTRLVEVLTSDFSSVAKLRTPAISVAQKVFNVGVAIEALKLAGCTTKVSAKAIVQGHRQMTMTLLWQIIMHFSVSSVLDTARLKRGVCVLKALSGTTDEDTHGTEEQVFANSPQLSLLLQWPKSVCARYNVAVSNFTKSFSDGRAMLYLIHHYCPGLVDTDVIQHRTTHTITSTEAESPDVTGMTNEGWAACFSPGNNKAGGRTREQLLKNERSNCKLLSDKVKQPGGAPLLALSADMSNTIPDEKVVIAYVAHLCVRLFDLSTEFRAALRIQSAWRRSQARVAVLANLHQIVLDKRERGAEEKQPAIAHQKHTTDMAKLAEGGSQHRKVAARSAATCKP